MSVGYLQGQDLYVACASGRGVIVMVEGETPQEDQYFYSSWFGGRAREVSFFAQNGWQRVVTAVADLRSRLSNRRVFGIVDRDFTDDASLHAQESQIPADGVFRTRLFTVENYLLDPSGWLRVAQILHRGSLPEGWATEAEVQARIEDIYRRCMPLAAFNFAVKKECERLTRDGIGYKQHPDAVQQPEAELDQWAARTQRNPPQPLSQVYRSHLQMLQQASVTTWPTWISGKAVLKVLALELPCPRGRIDPLLLSNFYLNQRPDPPAELAALVSRIVDRSGQP